MGIFECQEKVVAFANYPVFVGSGDYNCCGRKLRHSTIYLRHFLTMKFSIDFFLKNIGIRQTILKNTFWLAAAEVVVQLLKLALIIYMARILGAEEYGKFSFALSFVCLMVIFAELGLPDIITREFSVKKEAEKEYPAIISLKVFLSAVTFLAILASSFFITQDPQIRKSIWLLGIFMLITSFVNIVYAFFRAHQKMEYESVAKIAQYLVLTAFSFLVLFTIPSMVAISYVYFFTNIVFLIATVFFFHVFVQPLGFAYQKATWKKFIHFSWPLILGVSIGWIYVPVSSVMLGYFGFHMENGWYNAAYKIIGATVLSATLISRSFFPALNVASKVSKERIQNIWNYQKEAMIIVALPLMFGGVALAPKIIDFFYDASFAPSAWVFQWLAIVFAIDFLYYPYICALIIFGQERKGFFLIVAGLAITIITNILLIPIFALSGVVASNLISSVIVLVLTALVVVRYTPISPINAAIGKTFLVGLVASVGMYLVVALPMVLNFHLVIVVVVGILAYAGIFIGGCYFLHKSMYEGIKNMVIKIRQ